LIRGALQANPRVLREPPPVVQPMQFDDSAVSIAVRPWVAVGDQVAATGEIHAAVLQALRAGGVVIPLPQREVRLLGAGS
ncbi:MAG TPA: mechanosensitive ion channel family protein, partial [Steroidobacteraceae bacterium]|nr:mechanosensitive ion channel family protein [Steroidobacteraceae bacterium]